MAKKNERVCAVPGCGTKLNYMNASTFCSRHGASQEAREPNPHASVAKAFKSQADRQKKGNLGG